MTFADRYRLVSRRHGGARDPADPSRVLAMPLVLRIEKGDPPPRRDLLTAAARASVLLCLDDRVDPVTDPDPAADFDTAPRPGPWHDPVADWCGARIRKISRRARGAHWIAAQEVDGLTVTSGAAQARAIVPGPVGDLDRRIARLQIGGTDVEGDLDSVTADIEDLVLWVNPGLDMTVGKLAAQVGHGAMLAAALYPVDDCETWWRAGCPLTVAVPTPEVFARALDADGRDTIAVRDAGFTEVEPGSVTVVAARGAFMPVADRGHTSSPRG
ncbi:peptidyl-tRNA hydrolase [Williamsia herbipolensis]|uniref:peptidyl-tRNA hydrolase n=1 Tax=Williamsia herbipolensis TaxID=1603258 RepID=A0AAU4K5B4_9NOCA|nr:aminoacyl-tRNA hydrolase [Williamsia herbipolensis]